MAWVRLEQPCVLCQSKLVLLFWEKAFSAPLPHLGGIQAGEEPAQKEVIPQRLTCIYSQRKYFEDAPSADLQVGSLVCQVREALRSPAATSAPHLAGALPGVPGGGWQEGQRAGAGASSDPSSCSSVQALYGHPVLLVSV